MSNAEVATEIKEQIDAFKRERLGEKRREFIDTVTQEPPKKEEADVMDVAEG